MSNRVGGVSPDDPSKKTDQQVQQHRRIEKVEKIKGVDEAENEKMRKKFQSYMEEDLTEEPHKPGPLESGFYEGSKKSSSPFDAKSQMTEHLNGAENAATASPKYSQAPDLKHMHPTKENHEEAALPKSKRFWEEVDDSLKPATEPNYKETAASEAAIQNKILSEKEKQANLDEVLLEKTSKQKKEEETIASLPPPPGGLSDFEKQQDVKSHKKQEQSPNLPSNTQLYFYPEPEKEEKESHKQKFEPIELEAPVITSLPSHAMAIAENAALQATPYLNTETASLFMHMVGTIHVMLSPSDITRTEIILDSPSFANSIFFGSKITIERYDTAPDSFNIQLTGSNQAVTVFNQNIPNLYAAFQNGNFKFRIGRIDVEYRMEKPLFHRKERKGKDSGDLTDHRGG